MTRETEWAKGEQRNYRAGKKAAMEEKADWR